MIVKTSLAAVMLFAASTANAAFFSATLSGAAERPMPVASPATGFGTVRVIGDSIRVNVSFTGLTAGLAAGHLHALAGPEGSAGVAIGFPNLTPLLGSTSGTYTALIDLTLASSYTMGFVTASGGTAALAKARFLGALDTEEVYFNLHTSAFPGGEIRGNITAVPEPASWAMLVVGFGLAGTALRRRPAVAIAA